MLALNCSLYSPINDKKKVKLIFGISKRKSRKETHIPLLEAEFAGRAPCEAGKFSNKPIFNAFGHNSDLSYNPPRRYFSGVIETAKNPPGK